MLACAVRCTAVCSYACVLTLFVVMFRMNSGPCRMKEISSRGRAMPCLTEAAAVTDDRRINIAAQLRHTLRTERPEGFQSRPRPFPVTVPLHRPAARHAKPCAATSGDCAGSRVRRRACLGSVIGEATRTRRRRTSPAARPPGPWIHGTQQVVFRVRPNAHPRRAALPPLSTRPRAARASPVYNPQADRRPTQLWPAPACAKVCRPPAPAAPHDLKHAHGSQTCR